MFLSTEMHTLDVRVGATQEFITVKNIISVRTKRNETKHFFHYLCSQCNKCSHQMIRSCFFHHVNIIRKLRKLTTVKTHLFSPFLHLLIFVEI